MRSALVLFVGVLITAQADGGRVLADMRQALGGDAAIAALQGFAVTGTESRTVSGQNLNIEVEFLCLLPDRFLRIRRSASPFGVSIYESGFNGDQRILRRDSDTPHPPDPGEQDTPAEKAQRAARVLADLHREFARLATAMIGLPAIDPVDVAAAGSRVIEGRTTDALTLRAPDGYAATLFVDSATHLPWMISWMGMPNVSTTATVTRIVAVPSGQAPPTQMPMAGPRSTPSFGPMPDPMSLPPVEHQLFFDGYKTADGYTWPHQLVEKVGGKVNVTIKLGKYKINPKIDAKKFDPSR
jgi:hypothetical protein